MVAVVVCHLPALDRCLGAGLGPAPSGTRCFALAVPALDELASCPAASLARHPIRTWSSEAGGGERGGLIRGAQAMGDLTTPPGWGSQVRKVHVCVCVYVQVQCGWTGGDGWVCGSWVGVGVGVCVWGWGFGLGCTDTRGGNRW